MSTSFWAIYHLKNVSIHRTHQFYRQIDLSAICWDRLPPSTNLVLVIKSLFPELVGIICNYGCHESQNQLLRGKRFPKIEHPRFLSCNIVSIKKIVCPSTEYNLVTSGIQYFTFSSLYCLTTFKMSSMYSCETKLVKAIVYFNKKTLWKCSIEQYISQNHWILV